MRPIRRTPWRTSVRALARLADEGLVRRVGLANVNRRQLDDALELAPVAAVQVALSPFDDTRAPRRRRRALCRERDRGDRPLSARRAAPRGRSRPAARPLADVAEAHGATAAEVALAWLLALSPAVVAIPGARRPETARSAAHATKLDLSADDRDVLVRELGKLRPARRRAAGARRGTTRTSS